MSITSTEEIKVLQDKIGQLERRLLLRKFLIKALEIKRLEISRTAEQVESQGLMDQPAETSGASASQAPPKKLTFYDVVQLARHQASIEKAQDQVVDLIDLSESPKLALDESQPYDFQTSHDLLDLGDTLASQVAEFSLNSLADLDPPQEDQTANAQEDEGQLISELGSSSFRKSDCVVQPDLPELQASNSQTSHSVVQPDLPELQASKSHMSDRIVQPDLPELQTSEFNIHEMGSNETPVTIPDLDPLKMSLAQTYTRAVGQEDPPQPALPKLETADNRALPNLSSSAIKLPHYDAEQEGAETSPPSTAAPSVFSHASSLSSAASSLPQITKEELRGHTSSYQTVLRPRFPTTMYPLYENEPTEQLEPSNLNPTAIDILGLGSSPRPQSIKSEDHASYHSSQPQLNNIDEPNKDGYPWIVQAARDGDEEIIKRLLSSGADIRAPHVKTRKQALSEAAVHGHDNIVRVLIENGSPLDDIDSEGCTALHHACHNGHLEVAKCILSSKAAIDIPDLQGQTPLHLAMKNSHQSLVMLLIQNEANVNARDGASQTPLHIGAIKGNLAMCRHLLEEGAQIDSREAQAKTPLQFACEAGHCALVQMMLGQPTLVPTSISFLSAFFGAVEAGQVRIAECFFSSGLKLQDLRKDAFKPIILAAKSGSPTMVDLMVQENADVNAKDENGWNAVHFASYYGHYQAVERLIVNNVLTDAVNSKHQTPLLLAVKGGHFAVAESLLRANNDKSLMTAQDELCEQAVHVAARNGSLDILNLLLSNDAKLNVENAFGWQPVHIASAYGHLPVVERIVQQNRSVEEKIGSPAMKRSQTHKLISDGYWAEARWPYSGSRPLHLACEYGHYQVAKHLINSGAKLESSCSEGWQPLHHAAFIGNREIVEMLLGAGVYPHAVTNEGKTAQGLQFCTGGAEIPDEDKVIIRDLLSEAMERVRRQKSLKVALKKGSSVEEKNNLVRAATYSMNNVSKSHSQRPTNVTRASDPPQTTSYTLSTSRRPTLPHVPFTSPLPRLNRTFTAGFGRNSVSQPSESKAESTLLAKVPSDATASKILDPETKPAPMDVDVPGQSSSQVGPGSVILTTAQKSLDKQAPSDSEPAITPLKQRSTTLNFNRLKPGLDVSKMGLGNFGKQTTELGKQGLVMGKQSVDLGNRGLEASKQGFQKAAKFARMGKVSIKAMGKGKGKEKVGQGVGADANDNDDGDDTETKAELETEREGGTQQQPDGADEKIVVITDLPGSGGKGGKNDDDAGSGFSVGEFAEYGDGNVHD